jgi:hypothetical protein
VLLLLLLLLLLPNETTRAETAQLAEDFSPVGAQLAARAVRYGLFVCAAPMILYVCSPPCTLYYVHVLAHTCTQGNSKSKSNEQTAPASTTAAAAPAKDNETLLREAMEQDLKAAKWSTSNGIRVVLCRL